ncbi:helix-hairpin-helix domain-containing protein [Mycoplasma anserisalpingitidis]|uniref:helix-hairpin-helix domain-containing protein n=1 Tax=Mycoplasma anserisalpingitidis TaxID=519450 RepID=UPI001CF6E151|nr:Tex-like N-terminal domain-containing protein [Mycoplasma anserisalpingitidis]UCU26331.1 helix-hairpin-helix domain-containing protein [Mycoplasma anserisalpingitidis]UCU27170.1 helix-hairpin-helix domain-containing protein [Mycoplasma anserisalpingitidis]
MNTLEIVAKELKLKVEQINAVLGLIEEGATVAFIARYRKNITGGLDEEQIHQVYLIFKYQEELKERKESILKILSERNLLSKEIEEKINNTTKKADLEAIYEPFKVGKKTKASEAIALGLEPLAHEIFNNTDINYNPYKHALKFVNDKVESVEFAIEQALFIISQWISQDPKVHDFVKEQFVNYSLIQTSKKKNSVDELKTYENYYDFSQSVKTIQNYKILAINRAIKNKIIDLKFKIKFEFLHYNISNMFFKNKRTFTLIRNAAEDSLKRLIIPSIEREVFNDLFDRAEKSSIEIFANNLESMLMMPAVKNKRVLAVDPAYVNGCKLAMLNENGDLLETAVIYPNKPLSKVKEASQISAKVIVNFKPDVIVVGNGTASNETCQFMRELVKYLKLNIPVEMVSEVGASVYSASEIAIQEFPDLKVEMRSAINIGRKFQDPLNEIVKIDPKSIGIGQYQHDLNQNELAQALDFKVEKVVNSVGVNLNSATEVILTKISGISKTVAKNIVNYRKENGEFKNRNELKKVKALGAKTFEQAIGFLRIFNSEEFLDQTNIHPESYSLAKKIMKTYKYDQDKHNFAQKIDVELLTNEFNSDHYTINLIIDSLLNPGKDIRDNKKGFVNNDNITEFEEIKVGDSFVGRVQNITDFGIFVFIGIKDSVFIHSSKIENINSIKIGDDLNLEIINVDNEKRRLSAKLI